MEIWKDITNYEGLYQISNLGRVKALYREFIVKDGTIRKYPEKILKPDECCTSKVKYQRVTLSKHHETKRFQVHRLVAEHFIENTDNKPFVNHIDNDGLNNKANNLEWVTHAENMLHAQKQGRLFKAQSSGGKQGSKVNYNKMLNKVRHMIGNIFGCYIVISLAPKIKPKENKIIVECIYCNNQYVRDLAYIYNNAPNKCIKCKANKIKI